MGSKIATIKDIQNLVKVLDKHKVKPGKDGLITLKILKSPLPSGLTDVHPFLPFYRDSVGKEGLNEEKG